VSAGRPAHHLPGPVNGWVLLVGALATCPAWFRLAQGLVSVEEVLVRYLVVTLGAALVWAVLRQVWPAPQPRSAPAETVDEDAGPAA
jgi:hypothetical protein